MLSPTLMPPVTSSTNASSVTKNALLSNKTNIKTINISNANSMSNQSLTNSLSISNTDKCSFESNIKEIYKKLFEIDEKLNNDSLNNYFFMDNFSVENNYSTSNTQAQHQSSFTNQSNNVNTNKDKAKELTNASGISSSINNQKSTLFCNRVVDFNDWNEGMNDWTFMHPYPHLKSYANSINRRKNRNKDLIEFDEQLRIFLPLKTKPPQIQSQNQNNNNNNSQQNLDSNSEPPSSILIPKINDTIDNHFQSYKINRNVDLKIEQPIIGNHNNNINNNNIDHLNNTGHRQHDPNLNLLNNPIATEKLIKKLYKLSLQANARANLTNREFFDYSGEPTLNSTQNIMKDSLAGCKLSINNNNNNIIIIKRPNSSSSNNKKTLGVRANALPFNEFISNTMTNSTVQIKPDEVKTILNGANGNGIITTSLKSPYVNQNGIHQTKNFRLEKNSNNSSKNNLLNAINNNKNRSDADLMSVPYRSVDLLNTKKVLPVILSPPNNNNNNNNNNTNYVSSSSGTSSNNNTILNIQETSYVICEEDSVEHDDSFNQTDNNYGKMLNILNPVNKLFRKMNSSSFNNTSFSSKNLLNNVYKNSNQQNMSASSNSNHFFYLDEEGDLMNPPPNDSFFYVNSLSSFQNRHFVKGNQKSKVTIMNTGMRNKF
jgi:hypothetical protein